LSIKPVEIEYELRDQQTLDFADGLCVIHAPGHAAGQVVFLLPRHGGVLIAADTCGTIMGLGYPPVFEDLDEGVRSLKKLSGLEFAVAVFGHGRPLTRDAAQKFRQKWG
ncbi:MAG: MBL fold metallo-hydrolase, partial [Chloroflexota bacterium]|nr:MBL fold metallo-hydrolase [Chloroflexota bacterium]